MGFDTILEGLLGFVVNAVIDCLLDMRVVVGAVVGVAVYFAIHRGGLLEQPDAFFVAILDAIEQLIASATGGEETPCS